MEGKIPLQKTLFIFFMLFTSLCFAQIPALELKPENLSFDYLASDGGFWYDCTHKKGEQPHTWNIICEDYKFSLHLILAQYLSADETTYEFHYWASETLKLRQTQTQSTWLTVDKNARTKRVIAYLGFSNDVAQLRMTINLK